MRLKAMFAACAVVALMAGTLDASPRVTRRVERHDAERSRAAAPNRVTYIETVVIPGRRQRPLATIDTSVQPFRFPVGTARYSDRDRRFRKRGD